MIGKRSLAASTMALAVLVGAPAVDAATKRAKFKAVGLTGTQTSASTTTEYVEDDDGNVVGQCTRSSTEQMSLALASRVTAYVNQQRGHGQLRTLWSGRPNPSGPFDFAAIPATAEVAVSTSYSGDCGTASDCDVRATVPATIQFAGTRVVLGGAWVGARIDGTAPLESCSYAGESALRPYDDEVDYDDPAAHLFRAKQLFKTTKRKVVGSETFTASTATSSSTVELRVTLKRQRSK